MSMVKQRLQLAQTNVSDIFMRYQHNHIPYKDIRVPVLLQYAKANVNSKGTC